MSGMHGAGAAAAWRHLRSDRSVGQQPHRPAARCAGCSGSPGPHRPLISGFLAVTVVDAAHGRGHPAAGEADRRRRHPQGRPRAGRLAGARHGRRRGLSARCSASSSGWLSSRIGEGLIFDLRTRVFGHVQRQSLAFFTRTQTGALVSRLNNDVIGAQRAFTSTLSSTVANTIAVVVVGVTMLALSWQVTAALPGACSRCCSSCRRWVSGRLAGLTRRPDGRQRRPRQRDDRAVQRRRRDAAQAVRPPRRGGRPVRREGRPSSATSASGSRCVTRVFARRDDARPRAGHRPRLRRRRPARDQRAPSPSARCSRSPPCCCGCSARSRGCPTSGST